MGIKSLYRRCVEVTKRTLRLGNALLNILLVKPLHELGSPIMRILVKILQLLFFTLKDMGRNRTNIRTASLAFYTLLSIIPLLAVVFAAAKAMGYIDMVLDNLYGLFPQSPEIVEYCINFAENTLARTQGGLMAAIGGLTVLWTAIGLLEELVKAFNDTWLVTERRNIARYGAYVAILLFIPALWAGAEILNIWLGRLFGLSESWFMRILNELVSTSLELGIFVLIYKIVPHTKVEWRSAFVAGITAGAVFQIFHWVFTFIISKMTSYNAIYGSFAALPLFLFWIRYSWQILLTGNELAYAHQNLHLLQEERLNK